MVVNVLLFRMLGRIELVCGFLVKGSRGVVWERSICLGAWANWERREHWKRLHHWIQGSWWVGHPVGLAKPQLTSAQEQNVARAMAWEKKEK